MTKLITPEMLAASGTEDGEQMALFCYAVEAARADGRWALLYAIPNGGSRGDTAKARAIRGGRMKATGTKSGFPDVGLPAAYGGYHALFVELKRRKVEGKIVRADGTRRMIGGGIVGTDQESWHWKLHNEGNAVCVCYGWEQAANSIGSYLAGLPIPHQVCVDVSVLH